MKIVDLITAYQTGSGSTKLDIVIGDAQIGASVVKLNRKIMANGEVEALDLGDGEKLSGKTILTKSVVSDVNDATNRTSVEYIFRRGKDVQRFLSKAEVESNGDSIIYRAQFNLL
jgi:hypothetical protein